MVLVVPKQTTIFFLENGKNRPVCSFCAGDKWVYSPNNTRADNASTTSQFIQKLFSCIDHWLFLLEYTDCVKCTIHAGTKKLMINNNTNVCQVHSDLYKKT